MERTVLSWNITNWITVVLMVGLAYVAIGGVVSLGRQWAGGADTAGV